MQKYCIMALLSETNCTHNEDASGITFPAPNAGGAGGGLKGLYHEIFIQPVTRESRLGVEIEDILIRFPVRYLYFVR